MSFELDVAVIGGGPAGASTALHLVRDRGLRPQRVAVLDRARFPRDKPCAGAISQLGLDVLSALGVGVGVPSVPIRGVRVNAAGHSGETVAPMGVVVRRLAFDAHLLDVVRRDGVLVRDGEALVGLARVPGGFRLETSVGALTTRFVAVCDGAGGPTRKLLGLREPERKGHLYVLDTPPAAGDDAAARGLVDFDLSVLEDGLQGYYWDFPTILDGVPHVSRGIYHANLLPSADVKASLGRALARRGIDIAKVQLRPFATRPFVRGTQTWVPGAVLVGEAAGIDRTTGEGIAQAIAMGALAARHLARAVRMGSAGFEAYGREVFGSTIGRHMLESAWLAKRVYSRRGAPARRYLVGSKFARDAAVRWYRGESLPLSTQVRLAAGLAANAAAGQSWRLPSSSSSAVSSGRIEGALESISRMLPRS